MSGDQSTFDQDFFGDSARRGVQSFEFRTKYDPIVVDMSAALAFGFAEPAAGCDRRLEGVELTAENDILAEVRQVISNRYGYKYRQTSMGLVNFLQKL